MDGKIQLGRVPLSNFDESDPTYIFAGLRQDARGAFLNSVRAEAPRNRLFDHVNSGRTQRKLGEALRPGEKLVHNSRPYVLLRDNDGITWIKTGVLEA